MARCWAGDLRAISTVDADIPRPRTEGDALVDLPARRVHRADGTSQQARVTANGPVAHADRAR